MCGSSEQETQNSLILYPVPAHSHVYLQLFDNITIEAYSVYNLNGQLVESADVSNAQKISINTRDLLPSQYIIYVKTSGCVFYFGFVKE